MLMQMYHFYILVNADYPEHLYIGSTTDLKTRKRNHKYNCNTPSRRHYSYDIYKTIRDYGGFSDWTMICIHSQSMTKQACRVYENELIEMHKPNMNSIKPYRSAEYKREYNRNRRRRQRSTP